MASVINLAFLNSYPASLVQGPRLVGKLSRREPSAASCMAAPVQRCAIAAFDITADTAGNSHMFLTILAQASQRRYSAGRPRRMPIRIFVEILRTP